MTDGFREFRDERDRTWIVRAVYPSLTERRAPASAPPPDDRERRRRREVRVRLTAPFDKGWLVFKTGGEQRRYAPIPLEWPHASEAQLLAWCASAAPFGPPPRPVLPASQRRGPDGRFR